MWDIWGLLQNPHRTYIDLPLAPPPLVLKELLHPLREEGIDFAPSCSSFFHDAVLNVGIPHLSSKPLLGQIKPSVCLLDVGEEVPCSPFQRFGAFLIQLNLPLEVAGVVWNEGGCDFVVVGGSHSVKERVEVGDVLVEKVVVIRSNSVGFLNLGIDTSPKHLL